MPKGESPYEIRELVQQSAAFTCEMCNDNIFRAGKFRWKARSLVPDYETRTFNGICRKCIYRESFGSKYKGAAMKSKVIENG